MPYHDEVHAIWHLLGDVRKVQGGMGTVARANKAAARIIGEAVAALPPLS